jgi:hypothetical protein
MLGPGNGDGHAEFTAACGVVERTCERIDHPRSRALLRSDGAFGWVPYFAECRARGIPFMSRLTRPELFDQPDVLRTLREGSWHFVPDSRSGPRRSALDLGIVTVEPGQSTRRDDGTPYEPVTVRVVASRYPQPGKADHGRVIDGWQYELFAVDVAAEALPAPEAVMMFFGRAAEENGLAQEDREKGLDRIFSYHLPGQELAVTVGLWLWNLELVRGFELSPPPAVRPVQEPYRAEVDLRTVAVAADAPPEVSTAHDPQKEEHTPPDPAVFAPEAGGPSQLERRDQETPGSEEATSETTLSGSVPAEGAPPTVDGSPAPVEQAREPGGDEVVEELRRIDWTKALSKRAGWSFDGTSGHLLCEDGRELVLTTVRKGENAPGRTSLIFCRPIGGCQGCEPREGCLESLEPRAGKHLELSVSTPVAVRLRELLRARRGACREASPPSASPGARPPKQAGRGFRIAPLMVSPALFAVLPSLFLPAAARKLFRTAARGITVTIRVELPTPPPPWPVLVARSVGHKQHRRSTWQQHLDRHALSPEARVEVEIAGGGVLRRMLGGGSDDGKAAA